MIPNKELQELAQALKRTAEYNEMLQLRKRVIEHPRLGRQMIMFEREHTRLYNLGLQQVDVEPKLKKLYTDYNALLNEAEVKKFIESTHVYQKMIAECISYLNKNLETGKSY